MARYETHEETMRRLRRKKKIAEMKYQERKLKWEIAKMYFPIRFSIKFNKLIVMICIAAIVSYTIAAILLQKNTSIEVSPTLTTCFYAFFGTELIGLAGIKMMDTKFDIAVPSSTNTTFAETDLDEEDAVG